MFANPLKSYEPKNDFERSVIARFATDYGISETDIKKLRYSSDNLDGVEIVLWNHRRIWVDRIPSDPFTDALLDSFEEANFK